MRDVFEMAKEAGFMQHLGVICIPNHLVLERFAELVRADEREAILPMLKGIDETEIDSPDGWWETSSGAKFGAEILAAIRARGQA